MQNRVHRVLFSLLRQEVCGLNLDEETKNLITPEMLPILYKLSKTHDLAHLIADALDKNDLFSADNEMRKRFLQERNVAVYRYEQMQYELDEICRILEEEKIEYIPLKGSVLRAYYPEPWMRTSCDIDILIKEADLERAVERLSQKLGYKKGARATHDIPLYSPSNVHIELHFSLLEDNMANNASSILNDVWDRVETTPDSYKKTLQDEFLYYYHIAHMAKHVEFGGCGIKPFLDLWLLNEKVAFHQEKRDELLLVGGLKQFETIVKSLTYVWFENKEGIDATKKLEEYILTGGVYGSTENKVAAQAGKKGRGLRYIISRIWCPYDLLKKRYPRVVKCKLLIPYYQFRRWLRFLLAGEKRKSIIEAKLSKELSNEKAESVQIMLKEIGLQ